MRVNTLDGVGIFLKLSVVGEFCCSFGVVMIGIVVVGGGICACLMSDGKTDL